MYVDVKSCFEDFFRLTHHACHFSAQRVPLPPLPLFQSFVAFRERSHGIDGIGDSRAGPPSPGSGGLRWGHDPGAGVLPLNALESLNGISRDFI